MYDSRNDQEMPIAIGNVMLLHHASISTFESLEIFYNNTPLHTSCEQ